MARIGFVRDPEFQTDFQQIFLLRFKGETKTTVKYTGGGFKWPIYIPKTKLSQEGFPEQIVLMLQPLPGTKWREYASQRDARK